MIRVEVFNGLRRPQGLRIGRLVIRWFVMAISTWGIDRRGRCLMIGPVDIAWDKAWNYLEWKAAHTS